MDEPTNENATLASLDAIKAYLVGLITAAAQHRGGKVQLTYLGGEFTKAAGATFEKHLNCLAQDGAVSLPVSKRKMAPFLQAFCGDSVIVEKLPTGAFVVYPKADAGQTELPIAAVETRAALKFKRPVWAAFIRPLAQGKRFLNLEHIGFTDADEAPANGFWKEIEAEHILGAAPDSPVDGEELQRRIEKWARASDIPISTLVVSAPTWPSQNRSLNTLLDVIDSLPPHIAATWNIPASVLKHLRQAR